MTNFSEVKTSTKAWIVAKPLLAVAIGIVIGFILRSLL
jgi:ElaB/YqjD/DUF883 family membrane-anchored ribosome-binding protein